MILVFFRPVPVEANTPPMARCKYCNAERTEVTMSIHEVRNN
jgi:hypothetical protein